MNIHIRSFGRGIPLVFFHGWGFDSHIWMSLVPLLEDQYQLFLVDMPGFGLSDLMDWSVFKTQLLTQLPEQFALVGWSMGGLYAIRLTLEEPERVSHLLNVTSSPYFIADSPWPGVAKEVFQGFYNNLELDFNRVLREFISLQINKGTFEVITGNPPSREGLEAGLQILDVWDFREQLLRCTTPVCYMFGRLDPIVPVRTMEKMQSQYPQFQYVLFSKAAHMPFLSHPELFIAELTGFIK